MNSPDDLRLQRYLRGLPRAEPAPELGPRILAAHALRRRRRRWLVPLSVAAALMLAVLLPLALRTAPQPVGPSTSQFDPVILAEIRALDRRLQSAYLQPQTTAARQALWQARQQAETRLASGSPTPRLVQL